MNKMVQIFRDNCSHPRTGPFIKKGGFLLYFQLVYFWELNPRYFFPFNFEVCFEEYWVNMNHLEIKKISGSTWVKSLETIKEK